jgi:hypothetical protein
MTPTRARALLVISLLVSGLASCYLLAQQNRQEEAVNDEDISVSSFEEMHYPALARVAHRESVVVVQARLDDAGKVASARAISGSRMLIPDCVSNAKKWQFRPNARKTAVIIYEFQLTEGRCDAGKSLFVFREPNIASVTSCVGVWQP